MSENKIAKFVLVRPNAAYGVGAYTDPDTGEYVYRTMSQNKVGNPVVYRFLFSQGGGKIISVPEVWKDVEGKSMADFLRNHPECEGSPKNRGQLAYFKEIDIEKDAEIQLEAEDKIRLAVNEAAALKGDKLKYVALLIGENSDKESKQSLAVIQYAKSAPDSFMTMVKSPDVEVRAMVREGITKAVITKKGSLHMWETVNLGGDEDAAVANLVKDKDLKDAIKRAISLKK